MAEATTITGRVLDTLASAGLITIEQLSLVQQAVAGGQPAGLILSDRHLVTAEDVAAVMESDLGVPRVDLSSYAPDDDALALVPAQVAISRRILPLFEIEGVLTVAVGDPFDIFSLDDVAREIGFELDPVLTDPASLGSVIETYYGAAEEVALPVGGDSGVEMPLSDFETGPLDGEAPPPPPSVEAPQDEDERVREAESLEPFVPEAPEPASAEVAAPAVSEEEAAVVAAPAGASSIDLDVLAVADSRTIAVLVADVLADAVARGASRIHLLPYKDDFFLVYRVNGRLEKVASAPLSLQSSLVEGFKAYAKLSSVSATLPALGRVRAHLGERDLVLTVSAVPTVAGQRVVVSLVPERPTPPALADLGMSEAESRALLAMVERGRGILLVCAPVAAGRSTTFYALLAHAAAIGKTVFSVERSVDYELPSVAQVMVNPASAAGADAYMAAGLRQDTDVLAVDDLQNAAEIHKAVEAAGLGKLVIATFAAGDVASGVRRLLDSGAEPYSLAAALTLGAAQRLVRLNCPHCSEERRSPLAGRIAGVPADFVESAGTGCPNCGKTGFQGVTGVFEVLPFTEPVRARVARSGSGAELSAAAAAAGMRPMSASGLEKVRAGLLSLEELDRVLRLSE